jgi:signal transduction histidine kinase
LGLDWHAEQTNALIDAASRGGRSDDLVALVDRRRLEQALGNLVENALRHGSGTVRLEAVESSGALVLHVSDGGQGFPPDFLEIAFERFTHADASRGGAGLGLAIVATIAHAHGGAATASNKANGGADVALQLPGEPNQASG